MRRSGTLHRIAMVTVVAASGASLAAAAPQPAQALTTTSCPTVGGVQLTLSAAKSVTPPGGNPIMVCNGRVKTFDGTPLDIDVTLPTVPYRLNPSSQPSKPPLVVFMSGWSNDICQFESSTLTGTAIPNCGNNDFVGNPGYEWNNAWFASQGMVTLTYTPRGWWESCGKDSKTGYSYANDPACTSTPGEESWLHLYDRRWEIHDAQYLAGAIADARLVDPDGIVATGDSGGGGPSWDLALSQNRIMLTSCNDPTGQSPSCYTPWVSPVRQLPMHLAAAFPLYTWTDLVDALVSNGTASDGFHGAPADGNHHVPNGVEKRSYVAGLFALGQADAQYSAPGADPTSDLQSWYAAINAGEPYATNPEVQAALTQIGSAYRSPFDIPVPSRHRVPIFSIQGDTDPLFNALQTVDMVNRLKAVSPNYPVYSFIGDVGHSYAQNPLRDWQDAHALSNAFLGEVLRGQQITQPPITVDTTACMTGQTIQQYSGASLGALASSVLTFTSAASQTTTSNAAPTYEGTQGDPIANSGCRTMAASRSDPNQASYTFAVPSASTLMGGPVVHVTAAIVGSSAELAARLWDVDGSGNQTLISRTVYRFEEGSNGMTTVPLAMELWPNGWQLQCGHSIKLELTQDDEPVWRADNEQSSMTLSNMSLGLPVVPGAACS